MINQRIFLLLPIFLFFSCKKNEKQFFIYPKLENVQTIESHFDISYTDNYSNLEQSNDSIVIDWFKQQDVLAENYFQNNSDYKNYLKYLDSLENKAKDPARRIKYDESGLTFHLTRVEAGRNKLFFKVGDGESKFLFDSKDYKDGTYDIVYYRPSYNGKHVAIALSKEGHFFDEIVILNCNDKILLGNPIVNTKPTKAGGIVWTPDNNCISYIAYPNNGERGNDRNSYTALSCLNNLKSEPKVLFKNGVNDIVLNEEYYPIPMFRSMKSNYMFIYAGNASDFWDCYYLSVEDFNKGNYKWKKLYSSEDKIFHDWGTERNHKYYYKRLHGENQLSGFEITSNNIYYTITKNGIETVLLRYTGDGNDTQMDLPISAGEITFNYRSPYHEDLWVTIYGWTSNPKTYYLNPKNYNFEFVKLGMWPNYEQFEDIISEVIMVESHDGTEIPMSIVRKANHTNNGTAKGIITAYGAYGISETPWFHW